MHVHDDFHEKKHIWDKEPLKMQELKQLLGEGGIAYFLEKFPRLIIECWKAVMLYRAKIRIMLSSTDTVLDRKKEELIDADSHISIASLFI